MENRDLKVFVSLFVVLLLAVVFVSTLATQSNSVTTKTTVSAESHNLATLGCVVANADGGQVNASSSNCNVTLTNAPTSWKKTDCPLTSVVVSNGTTGQTFTLNTDYYLFASTGVVQFLNSTGTQAGHANATVTAYNYCGTGYLNSSWGRSVLGVNVGLFAVAILLVAAGVVYYLLEEKKRRDED